MGKHDHACPCRHEDIQYCAHCRVVHCKDCGREWQDNPSGYWYYPATTGYWDTTVITTPGINTVTTGACGHGCE